MAGELLIDGSRLSWQDFADRLVALAATPHASGDVVAPRACGIEAIRLLNQLDLADRVVLVAPPHARPAEPIALPRRLRDVAGAALAALRLPTAPPRKALRD